MTGPRRPPTTVPNEIYKKLVALVHGQRRYSGEMYAAICSYLSLSELTSEAMAFNAFMAIGMPPPRRKNKDPSVARRTWGVSPITTIKGPHANPRSMPTYARMKLGLRPMLQRGQQLPFQLVRMHLPIGHDTPRKRCDQAHCRADHGCDAAQISQLLLDAVDLA